MKQYKSTLFACYTGFIAQAAVVNLAPILFVVFQDKFDLSFEMLGRLIMINFTVQIGVDLFTVKFADRFKTRRLAVTAHLMAFAGLFLLGILPGVFPKPYWGIILASVIYAAGGGLLEVVMSPVVEALPLEKKSSAMSLLHSFYCWGQVGVCLLSTLYIRFFGEDYWFILPFVWSLIPLWNMFVFMKVPMIEINLSDEKTPLKTFFKSKIFLFAMLLMICAGASEQVISQWSSLFAEKGLGVSKFVGDLLGPVSFALLMGLGRMLFGIFGHKIHLKKALTFCAALAVICYFTISLVKIPLISLIACALCGFAVSLMWPGMLSLTAEKYPRGGCAMFGLLAVMGDIGCALGPGLAGIVSDSASHTEHFLSFSIFKGLQADQIALKLGILAAVIFPMAMLVGVLFFGRSKKRQ